MGRVTFDLPMAPGARPTDLDVDDLTGEKTAASGGPTAAPEAPGLPPRTGPARLADELGRLYDALDRVARDGERPGSAGVTNSAQRRASAPAAGSGAAADAPVKHARGGRVGSPPGTIENDKAALPSRADCQRSLAAIGAAGFTDVRLRPVPYFYQGESSWSHEAYPRRPAVPGETRTIGRAGCAPTSLAMIDCGLRDSHLPPTMTAKFAVANDASGTPSSAGTNTAKLARLWAKDKGLALTEGLSARQSKNVDVLKAGLLANGIALVSIGAAPVTHVAHFSSQSHVVVINGCARRNGEDWFAVADPGHRDQAAARPPLSATDDNVMKVGAALRGVGQVWISRTQLEAEMKRCYVLRSGNVS